MLNDRRLDFKSPKPPGAHLSHKDNADLSARKPRESEDRHPVDVEHLEVLGGAEIPDLVSGTGGLRGAPRTAPGVRWENELSAELRAHLATERSNALRAAGRSAKALAAAESSMAILAEAGYTPSPEAR